MNKQEAIEQINYMDTLNINDKTACQQVDMVIKNQVLDIIDQIDEPQKPVVPQFVADWVANSREYDYEFCDFFDCNYQSEEVYRWLKCENRRQSELNSLALSMLVVHGRDAVIVEEEKLYTVEIPNPNGGEYSRTYLGKYASGKVGLYNWTGFTHIAYADDWKKEEKAQLTEAEIKKDFDWAWQFAEEVKEC